MEKRDVRVLVTGAAGFVGSRLVQALVNKGMQVRALDLDSNPAFQQLRQSVADNPHIDCVGADITDPQAVASAVQGCQYIFHVAALLNSIAAYDTFYRINVGGTENLCRAAVDAGVERFVLVSTSDVFGIPESADQILSEASGYRPWGEPYADTKIKACETVRRFHQLHQLPYTIVYPGWVYGPGDQQFFPAILDMLKDGVMFVWHRKTPYYIDFVYIDDLVEGILTAGFCDAGLNDDFLLLDSDSPFTMADLALYLAEAWHYRIRMIRLPYRPLLWAAGAMQWLARHRIIRHHLLSRTDVKAFGNAFRFSNRKARDTLGWVPRTSLLTGLDNYVAWAKSADAAPSTASQ